MTVSPSVVIVFPATLKDPLSEKRKQLIVESYSMVTLKPDLGGFHSRWKNGKGVLNNNGVWLLFAGCDGISFMQERSTTKRAYSLGERGCEGEMVS